MWKRRVHLWSGGVEAGSLPRRLVNPKGGLCFSPSGNWATVAGPEHQSTPLTSSRVVPLHPKFPESYLPQELPGRWNQDLASLKDPEQGI